MTKKTTHSMTNDEQDYNLIPASFNRSMTMLILLVLMWMSIWIVVSSNLMPAVTVAAETALIDANAWINERMGVSWGGAAVLGAILLLPHLALVRSIRQYMTYPR